MRNCVGDAVGDEAAEDAAEEFAVLAAVAEVDAATEVGGTVVTDAELEAVREAGEAEREWDKEAELARVSFGSSIAGCDAASAADVDARARRGVRALASLMVFPKGRARGWLQRQDER